MVNNLLGAAIGVMSIILNLGLGMAIALWLSGVLMKSTGFDVHLGAHQAEHTVLLIRLLDVAVPFVTSAVAVWAVLLYPLTEKKSRSVRWN